MKTNPLKTVIIDDELQSVRLLEDMAGTMKLLTLAGSYTDPVKALLDVRNLSPDLILLDIQMPRMSGFEFLRGIRNAGLAPWIIFITAYDQFAIEAIHQEAFDYLMKPISLQELDNSVSRLNARIEARKSQPAIDLLLTRVPVQKLRFSDRNGISFFSPEEIIYVEAEGNYSNIFLKKRQHLVTRKIGEMEEILAPHGFIRVGRSFIINPVYLSRIDRRRFFCILEHDGATYEVPVSEEKLKGI